MLCGPLHTKASVIRRQQSRCLRDDGMGHLSWGLLTQSFAGMSKYMPAQHISDAERKFSLLCTRQHESADLATQGLEPEGVPIRLLPRHGHQRSNTTRRFLQSCTIARHLTRLCLGGKFLHFIICGYPLQSRICPECLSGRSCLSQQFPCFTRGQQV